LRGKVARVSGSDGGCLPTLSSGDRPHRIQHDVRISPGRFVRKPENLKALLSQPGVARGVPLFSQAMNAAVQFDHQLEPWQQKSAT
jgi:hypothetical protein